MISVTSHLRFNGRIKFAKVKDSRRCVLNPVQVPDLPRLGYRKVINLRFLTLAGVSPQIPKERRKSLEQG